MWATQRTAIAHHEIRSERSGGIPAQLTRLRDVSKNMLREETTAIAQETEHECHIKLKLPDWSAIA
jgi:hypothetical protein